jgi:hypothetical protein
VKRHDPHYFVSMTMSTTVPDRTLGVYICYAKYYDYAMVWNGNIAYSNDFSANEGHVIIVKFKYTI